ncbi:MULTISPECIES: hypothetical protein [unclassified Cryobacterium]|uniref:hypothetical protein n=1 Tax=unclassified Cryobacterium TaxID=2649013 RepID=UPI001304FA30|nr:MULTISPECIES: hypothetical protein [unclassified Cryobacterium]
MSARLELVKSCSDACRNRAVTATDLRLEESISTLLAARVQTITICLSEAATAVGDEK